MSQSTVTFSSGCGALGGSAFGLCPLRPLAPAAPGTIVSSARLALARPPEPMNAMFSLLFRFCPRRIAGAPAITPAVISVRPTNSRRVISRAGRIFAESFIDLPQVMIRAERIAQEVHPMRSATRVLRTQRTTTATHNSSDSTVSALSRMRPRRLTAPGSYHTDTIPDVIHDAAQRPPGRRRSGIVDVGAELCQASPARLSQSSRNSFGPVYTAHARRLAATASAFDVLLHVPAAPIRAVNWMPG